VLDRDGGVDADAQQQRGGAKKGFDEERDQRPMPVTEAR
jgi:hypothetical protein